MSTQEHDRTHAPASKQLESEGTSFLSPPQFSLTASSVDSPDGGGGGKTSSPAEPKMDVSLQETFGEETVVKGMSVLGTKSTPGLQGKPRVRFLLVGSAAQWSEILKYADDDAVFADYIAGFLLASTNPAEYKESTNVFHRDSEKTALIRVPTENEKLEFLKALYGVEVGNSELDMVNTMAEEGFVNMPNTDISSPLLAAFIRQHQQLLIQSVSKKGQDKFLASDGVSTLADQATRESYSPLVVHAMIQNAYATACAAAKMSLAMSAKAVSGQQTMDFVSAHYMVKNSAKIIQGAIDAYDERVASLEDGAGSVFDEVWGMIKIPDAPGMGIVIDYSKNAIKSRFIEGMVGLGKMKSKKEELLQSFSNVLLGGLQEIIGQYGDQLDGRVLAGEFTNLIDGFEVSLK
jgi:hypothetical protein